MKTMKLLLLVGAVLVCTVASAQVEKQVIGRLDTLPKSQRDKIIIEMARKAIYEMAESIKLEEPITEFYRLQDTPTIHDLGIWQGKENTTIKSNAINYVSDELKGKRVYVITFPLNQEEQEYCAKYEYKFSMTINGDSGYATRASFGPMKKTVAKAKFDRAHADTIARKRAEYLERVERMKQEQKK